MSDKININNIYNILNLDNFKDLISHEGFNSNIEKNYNITDVKIIEIGYNNVNNDYIKINL